MIEGLFKITCGATVLADGTAAGGICERLTINGVRIVEEVPLNRADWISIFERGNKRNAFEFTISVQHATLLLSTDAAIGLNDDLPVRADFKLELLIGATTYTALMRNAGWKDPSVELIGLSTKARFSVVGGEVERSDATGSLDDFYDGGDESTAPNTYDEWLDGGNEADAPLVFEEVLDFNT